MAAAAETFTGNTASSTFNRQNVLIFLIFLRIGSSWSPICEVSSRNRLLVAHERQRRRLPRRTKRVATLTSLSMHIQIVFLNYGELDATIYNRFGRDHLQLFLATDAIKFGDCLDFLGRHYPGMAVLGGLA